MCQRDRASEHRGIAIPVGNHRADNTYKQAKMQKSHLWGKAECRKNKGMDWPSATVANHRNSRPLHRASPEHQKWTAQRSIGAREQPSARNYCTCEQSQGRQTTHKTNKQAGKQESVSKRPSAGQVVRQNGRTWASAETARHRLSGPIQCRIEDVAVEANYSTRVPE